MLQKTACSLKRMADCLCVLGERKAIDFVWKNFTLVLFIISRRAMKSSKAKSITAMLAEARAALWLMSNRQVSRGDAPVSELLLVPLPVSLDPCQPLLLSIKLLRQHSESTALRPQYGAGVDTSQAGPVDLLSQKLGSGAQGQLASECGKNRRDITLLIREKALCHVF